MSEHFRNETFHTEREGRTRRELLAAVHDDAVRYFDGVAFELVGLTVERITVSHSGHSRYAAAATYLPAPEGATR